MALNCNTKHPLQHDGTSQQQRFLEALEPSYAKIHEFNLRDWMRFAFYYASRLKYFNLSDDKNPDGNWQVFMKAEDEFESLLKDAALAEYEDWIPAGERETVSKRQPEGNVEPHLALFLSFLKLLRFPQEQINGITKRHLDFYYQQVLRLSHKPAVPDRVHLVFELARNAANAILPKGTQLDGGKDKIGKPVIYATGEELVVNHARIAMLKSIYHKTGETIRYAEKTDSLDGLGTEFSIENPSWNAFGNENWPSAKLGFALASQVLFLKEGKRKIKVEIALSEVKSADDFPAKDVVQSQTLLLLSGEKNWIEATDFEVTHIPGKASNKLGFTIHIDASEKAIVPYNPKIHEEKFSTNLPVLRVLINTGNEDGYALYSALENAIITQAAIEVEVSGVKDLNLENDQGKLDGSKPFYPFGTVPAKGSNFYIGSAEIFQKNWDYVNLNIAWKNKPDSLRDHYDAYRQKSNLGSLSVQNLSIAKIGEQSNAVQAAPQASKAGISASAALNTFRIVKGEEYFTVKGRYIKDSKWFPDSENALSQPLFGRIKIERDSSDAGFQIARLLSPLQIKKGVDINKAVLTNYLLKQPAVSQVKAKKSPKPVSAGFVAAKFDPGFPKPDAVTGVFNQAVRNNYLRLTLDNSFLHELYVNLFSLAMIEKAKTGADVAIPNMPYTPEIASLTVDYKATATNVFVFGAKAAPEEKLSNFKQRDIQLFHEHPFGQSEQHIFLKEQSNFLDPDAKRKIRLLPVYNPEGELYIGLEKANASDIVSLLIQAVEGTEDPLAPTFREGQAVQWFALVNNEWQQLNNDFISKNSTNNLLRAGIVKMQLPAGANTQNTLLNEGYHWIKAQLPNGLLSTSVCKLSGVHAQGIEAIFSNHDNDLSHLLAAVPAGSIKKFIATPPLVKSVGQPYATFGGAAKEEDMMFYLRVSERLRHKNRAVSIWDYERLVLQQFPSVYKVKCLSHTSTWQPDGKLDYFELNPGYVSLIVIPDLRNRESYDPLQPRASQNLLREIEDYINPLSSLHVKFDAENPDYETVVLDFRVKFHKQFDPNAYLKILNDDLVKYLSPWAYGDFSRISFGGSIYKSVVIAFVENRPYVDFISQVKMYHRKDQSDKNTTDRNFIAASSARAILVSAGNHAISLIDNQLTCDERNKSHTKGDQC